MTSCHTGLWNHLSVEDKALLAQFHQGHIDFNFEELLSPIDGREATHNNLSRIEEEAGYSKFHNHPAPPISSRTQTPPSPLTSLSPSFSLRIDSPIVASMSTPLPKRDECSAPKFDPTARAAGIDEDSDKMKKTILGYLDAKTMKFWQSLDTFNDDTKTWEEFKTEILDYYPGTTETDKVTTEELNWPSTTKSSQWWLKPPQQTLFKILIAQHYVRPFPENIRARIDTGLYVHYPTKKVGQAYTINETRKVITFLLSDASAPVSSGSFCSGV
ncbi:hypothetical protein C8R41DRAFT_923241 [Lentinula lateritia]|uniref:Uncharacterized protein n=1 Tax=Lentinula lateritia TaxID=40482 RepID=A0ABQ8V6L5_9AGAR|nr:hypothetical protein C8R41DRAFT_923241 [Lentinula lateritia]